MLSAGQALTPLEISSVDADKMKVMALILDDPNPIHYDANAVQRLGLGDRPINQGPNGVAYVINMLMASSPRAKAVALCRRPACRGRHRHRAGRQCRRMRCLAEARR